MKGKKSILFLCVANSCRSQMAEGLARHYYGDLFELFSAGAVATVVHPLAIRVMNELGIDISQHRSKAVEEFSHASFDYVITVCGANGKGTCPIFTGKAGHTLTWNFFDPVRAKGTDQHVLEVFRRVRDEIKRAIDGFVEELKKEREV